MRYMDGMGNGRANSSARNRQPLGTNLSAQIPSRQDTCLARYRRRASIGRVCWPPRLVSAVGKAEEERDVASGDVVGSPIRRPDRRSARFLAETRPGSLDAIKFSR